MDLGSRVLVRSAEAQLRRAARERRRTLRREIAAYRSPADRAELEAILDRYPDGVTEEIRGIVRWESWKRRS